MKTNILIVLLLSGATVIQPLPIIANVNISMQGYIVTGIHGRITDRETGRAVPYANVYVKGTAIVISADKDGYYKLKDIPGGKVMLEVKSIGYDTARKRIVLTTNKDYTVDFDLVSNDISLKGIVVSGESRANADTVRLSRGSIELLQSSTLGETLSKIPGIQNSYYGPNSGTPVIRGISGNRVKVLNDGIGINDLNGISPDFNVNLNMTMYGI